MYGNPFNWTRGTKSWGTTWKPFAALSIAVPGRSTILTRLSPSQSGWKGRDICYGRMR